MQHAKTEVDVFCNELMSSEAPETTFDWFLSPAYLLPFLSDLLSQAGLEDPTQARILMLGCGNSALGEVMYDAGYKNVVNIDVRPFPRANMFGQGCGLCGILKGHGDEMDGTGRGGPAYVGHGD